MKKENQKHVLKSQFNAFVIVLAREKGRKGSTNNQILLKFIKMKTE